MQAQFAHKTLLKQKRSALLDPLLQLLEVQKKVRTASMSVCMHSLEWLRPCSGAMKEVEDPRSLAKPAHVDCILAMFRDVQAGRSTYRKVD